MPPFRPRPDVQVATLAEVDLPGWLAIATYNLEPAAKQRIKLEIGSHFNEAIAAYLADGFTPGAAQATALADLGDAQTAAKRFKKTYLTVEEEKKLKSLENEAAKPFFSSAWELMLPVLPLAFLPAKWRPDFIAPFIDALTVSYVFGRAVPRFLNLRFSRSVSLRRTFALSNLLGALGLMTVVAFDDRGWLPLVALLLWRSGGHLSFFTWKKLSAESTHTGTREST